MGYFEMIDTSEIFVVLDHVQFKKQSWQQRNRIKTAEGEYMLSVPVKKKPHDMPICEMEISYDTRRGIKYHWRKIALEYRNAPYFKDYKNEFERIYSTQYTYLRDLNLEIIKAVCRFFGIETRFVLSSELNLDDGNLDKTERLVNLCKVVGITYLYDAKGAAAFINTSLFDRAGVRIMFQNYHHPTYRQLFGQFIPYMSVIDLLFNEGQNSLEIIRSGRRKPIDYLFFRKNDLKITEQK